MLPVTPQARAERRPQKKGLIMSQSSISKKSRAAKAKGVTVDRPQMYFQFMGEHLMPSLTDGPGVLTLDEATKHCTKPYAREWLCKAWMAAFPWMDREESDRSDKASAHREP